MQIFQSPMMQNFAVILKKDSFVVLQRSLLLFEFNGLASLFELVSYFKLGFGPESF